MLFGGEFALTDRVSLGAQGRWVRFGSFSADGGEVGPAAESRVQPASGRQRTGDLSDSDGRHRALGRQREHQVFLLGRHMENNTLPQEISDLPESIKEPSPKDVMGDA